MHKIFHLRQRKQGGQSLRAASDNSPRHRHLYMMDRITGISDRHQIRCQRVSYKGERKTTGGSIPALCSQWHRNNNIRNNNAKPKSWATPSLLVAIYYSQCDTADYRIRLPFFLPSSTRHAAEEINRWKNGTYSYRIRPRYKISAKFPKIVQLSGRHRSQAHQTTLSRQHQNRQKRTDQKDWRRINT